MGLSFADLLTIARRTGYPVVSAKSTRNNGTMGSVQGCVKHHTGTNWNASGDYPTFNIVKEGRTGLYNSLSAYGLGKSGTIYVFNELVSWHAGVADWNGATDVNGRYLGIEAESDGVNGHWTAQQIECYPRLVAEILRFIGKNPNTGNHDPRHAQVANPAGRKSDFSGMDLADHDRRILAWYNNPSETIVAEPTGPAIVGGIRSVYNRPGVSSRLGTALDIERPCAGNTGWYQVFKGGKIWWSAKSFGHPVWGAIGHKYEAWGAESSGLGYPTSDEKGTHDGGVFQEYDGGVIVWRQDIGVAFAVQGAINTRYKAIGGTYHTLGYPLTDERTTGTKNGAGWYSRFQKGVIVWSVKTGAWEVYGDIADKYIADGGTEFLGFPVSAQWFEEASGCWWQKFSLGYYNWKNGQCFAIKNSMIDAGYANFGWAVGALGAPIGNEVKGLQKFEHGTLDSILSKVTIGKQVWRRS